MFALFPAHRPRIGISIRAHALDLVEVRRRWGRVPHLVRVATRPLPVGLVTPGATTPNVSAPATLAKELSALFEGIRDRAVAIDLPMACGTLALMHFETFPKVRAEQESLLRWRLRQDEHLAASDLTLVWHTIPFTESDSTAVSVFMVAIRQSIVDQYHQICEAADVLPMSMGFSTLHLVELARTVLPMEEEVYVAQRTAESLIVLAFRYGRPIGLRVKPLRRTHLNVKEAVLQTLRYFEEHGASRQQKQGRTTPLYLVEERISDTDPALTQAQPEIWTLSEQTHWTVPVHRATWTTVPIEPTQGHSSLPPLGALAGVLAA